MAKQRPSLEAFAQSAQPQDNIPAATELSLKAENILSLHTPMPSAVSKTRKDRPHTTLYLDKRVQKVIKEIALQYDRKSHDLYLEGIDLMLTHYGRPNLKELTK